MSLSDAELRAGLEQYGMPASEEEITLLRTLFTEESSHKAQGMGNTFAAVDHFPFADLITIPIPDELQGRLDEARQHARSKHCPDIAKRPLYQAVALHSAQLAANES